MSSRRYRAGPSSEVNTTSTYASQIENNGIAQSNGVVPDDAYTADDKVIG